MEKPTALAPRTKIVTSKRATLNSKADESIHVVHRIEVEEPKCVKSTADDATPDYAKLRSNDKLSGCKLPNTNGDGSKQDLPPMRSDDAKCASERSDTEGSVWVKPETNITAPGRKELRINNAKAIVTAPETETINSKRAELKRLSNESKRAASRGNGDGSGLAKSNSNVARSQRLKLWKKIKKPEVAASRTKSKKMKSTHTMPQVSSKNSRCVKERSKVNGSNCAKSRADDGRSRYK